MLILTRKEGQSIMIGDDIELVVTKFNHRQNIVSLGFKAPRSVEIARKEVWIRPNHGKKVDDRPD